MIISFLYIIANKVRVVELRDQVENARRITEEQRVVLDKLRRVHQFFRGFEAVCENVEDVSQAAPQVVQYLSNHTLSAPSVH